MSIKKKKQKSQASLFPYLLQQQISSQVFIEDKKIDTVKTEREHSFSFL